MISPLMLTSCQSGKDNHQSTSLPPSPESIARLSQHLESVLTEEHLVKDGVSAAVLIVSQNGYTIFHQASGIDGDGKPLKRDAQFDIASLTKPVATASAISILMCEGKLSPDEILGDYTIEEILLHRTSLPSTLDWQEINQPDVQMPEILGLVESTPQQMDPGYSNSGYVLLASKAESMVGENLEHYLRDVLWDDLGMKDTTYLPNPNRCVPSATDQQRGRPYDPLADFFVVTLDKAPGHSGLFSTAYDLDLFAQALIRNSSREDDSDHDTLHCWAQSMTHETQWGRSYGFDITGSGALLQTGYTGCVMWIDPESGKSYVLLTNRTLNDAPNFERLDQRIRRAVKAF